MRPNWIIPIIRIFIFINIIVSFFFGYFITQRLFEYIPKFLDLTDTAPYYSLQYMMIVYFGISYIYHSIMLGILGFTFKLEEPQVTKLCIILLSIDVALFLLMLIGIEVNPQSLIRAIKYYQLFSNPDINSTILGLDLVIIFLIFCFVVMHKLSFTKQEHIHPNIILKRIRLILGVLAIIINSIGMNYLINMNKVLQRDYGTLTYVDYSQTKYIPISESYESDYGHLIDDYIMTADHEFMMLYWQNDTDQQLKILKFDFSSTFDRIDSIELLLTPIILSQHDRCGIWINDTSSDDLHMFTLDLSGFHSPIDNFTFDLIEFNTTHLISNRTFPPVIVPEDCIQEYSPDTRNFGIDGSILWVHQMFWKYINNQTYLVDYLVRYQYPLLQEIDCIELPWGYAIHADLEGNLWYYGMFDPLGGQENHWSSLNQQAYQTYCQFTDLPGIGQPVKQTIQTFDSLKYMIPYNGSYWDIDTIAELATPDRIIALYENSEEWPCTLMGFVVVPLYPAKSFREVYYWFGSGLGFGGLLFIASIQIKLKHSTKPPIFPFKQKFQNLIVKFKNTYINLRTKK